MEYNSQIICFVTLGLYGLGSAFFLCGLAAPNWGDTGPLNYGLFMYCLDSDGSCEKMELDDQEDWFKITAGLMLLALFGMLASGVSLQWPPISGIAHSGTSGLIFIAVILFAVKKDSGVDLDWAYILSIISGVFYLANGVVLLVLAMANSCDMSARPIPCIGGPSSAKTSVGPA